MKELRVTACQLAMQGAHFADFHLKKANEDFGRAIALIAHALRPKVKADPNGMLEVVRGCT